MTFEWGLVIPGSRSVLDLLLYPNCLDIDAPPYTHLLHVLSLLFLFLSGLRMRAGYETNDEEKGKSKFKPASVKEPPSHLRLLHFGSSVPLENHLSQALSNGIDPAPPELRPG